MNDSVYSKLYEVQKIAKAPRAISGKFGKSRSAEQILEAYKPICNDKGLYLYTSDKVVRHGDRNYIEATATVINIEDPSQTHSATALAWENEVELSKAGSAILDTSQVTGKTSSYAKKYALQNLFAIDDTKDADNDKDYVPPTPRVIANKSGADQEILARAKDKINKELEKAGYITPDVKRAFLVSVIEQDKIDNLNQADSVMDAIENLAVTV